MKSPPLTGPEIGVRAAFFYAGWRRALHNMPLQFGYSSAKEDRVIKGFLAAQCRKDVHVAMGWWPKPLAPPPGPC